MSAELAAHVDACVDCHSFLELEQRRAARVDAVLAEAIAVAPASDFGSRIRRRLAQEPIRKPTVGGFWVAAAVLAVAIAGAMLLTGPEGHSLRSTPTRIAQSAHGVPRPLPPQSVPQRPAAQKSSPRALPEPTGRRVSKTEDERVLVLPGQVQAVQRLWDIARREPIVGLPQEIELRAPLPTPPELTPPPLLSEQLKTARLEAEVERPPLQSQSSTQEVY
jgi:hypothetical protein